MIDPGMKFSCIAFRFFSLAQTQSSPLYDRLGRGMNALVAAMRAYKPDERIHQSVRAVEALLPEPVFRKDAFVEHVRTFVEETADSDSILREIYQLRNAAEHLRGLDARALPTVSSGNRQAIAMQRTRHTWSRQA